MKQIPEFVLTYPMGPSLRQWLGVLDSDYRGSTAEIPTSEAEQAFGAWLMDFAADNPLQSPSQFTDIVEELVGMHLPMPALRLAGYFPDLIDQDDFRTQFQLGNASMLGGDLELAERCFIRAQELIPDESAPYVNLAQIYFHLHRDQECREWLEAGLRADLNNTRLWELLASVELATDQSPQRQNACGKRLLAKAESESSWAGISLACDMMAPEEPHIKLGLLENLYHQGLRDHRFLVELTAVMGAAGQFNKISPVIWQAEKLAATPLPWQVLLHGAQAQLALGQPTMCLEYLEKLKKLEAQQNAQKAPGASGSSIDPLPDNFTGLIAELTTEANELLNTSAAERIH